MSENRGSSKNTPEDKRKAKSKDKVAVTPAARRKQIIVGLIMGLVMGLLIGWLTGFWYWLPAGLAFGLAVGAIMRPPTE